MNKTEDVDVCTTADIGIEIIGSGAPPMIDAIDEYLSIFSKPVKRDDGNFLMGRIECLKCGKALDGPMGSFQWGIANGEGNCSGCGWPCRAHHSPKDSDGEIFDKALVLILQYHPSRVMTPDGESDFGESL